MVYGLHHEIEGIREDKLVALAFHAAAICVEITIGVAIVDRLLEREREREVLHSLAAALLNDILYVTWVWTGSSLFANKDTTPALSSVTSKDYMYPATESLALKIGRQANTMLLVHHRLINEKRNSDLYVTLLSLSLLAAMRGFDSTSIDAQSVDEIIQEAMNETDVAGTLREAYESLCGFLNLATPADVGVPLSQASRPDTSFEAQAFRHSGKRAAMKWRTRREK